jgi:DNA-binding NarL/FixJ family response regulator
MILNVFNIFLLASIILGIALMSFSLYMYFTDKGRRWVSADNTIKALELSIEEMNRTMEEFGAASRAVFRQLEEKRIEVQKLYSLAGEKKGATIPLGILSAEPENPGDPRAEDVFLLKNKGLSVQDIAKKLGMGQGEVRLILELGKL